MRLPKKYWETAWTLILFFEWACHIKNVDILGGTPTWDLDVPVHGTVANHAGWPSLTETRRLSRVCDSAVTGNPPNRVGGTPIEGLAGLVRARARRGPSSRQKYIRLAFLAIFLYKMLVA